MTTQSDNYGHYNYKNIQDNWMRILSSTLEAFRKFMICKLTVLNLLKSFDNYGTFDFSGYVGQFNDDEKQSDEVKNLCLLHSTLMRKL